MHERNISFLYLVDKWCSSIIFTFFGQYVVISEVMFKCLAVFLSHLDIYEHKKQQIT